MYAIQNIKTKKFVYGTNRRKGRYNEKKEKTIFEQFTSFEKAIIYDLKESADIDMRCRSCGKNYKVVEVSVKISVLND